MHIQFPSPDGILYNSSGWEYFSTLLWSLVLHVIQKKLQAHYKELANKRNLHEKDKQEFLKYI